ncbi:MAG: DUF2007 domain-containing protein [Candidatus Eisenbacteria bacterium]|nr:DUF2007 domain-containing protein [Candidatus Eisenbacteria bacterium]
MKLVVIAKMQNNEEAMVVKSLLDSEGIPCVYQSPIVQSVQPITIDGLGTVRILVNPEDEERARELLTGRKLPGLVAEEGESETFDGLDETR